MEGSMSMSICWHLVFPKSHLLLHQFVTLLSHSLGNQPCLSKTHLYEIESILLGERYESHTIKGKHFCFPPEAAYNWLNRIFLQISDLSLLVLLSHEAWSRSDFFKKAKLRWINMAGKCCIVYIYFLFLPSLFATRQCSHWGNKHKNICDFF
jgi:hypothetical protein